MRCGVLNPVLFNRLNDAARRILHSSRNEHAEALDVFWQLERHCVLAAVYFRLHESVSLTLGEEPKGLAARQIFHLQSNSRANVIPCPPLSGLSVA